MPAAADRATWLAAPAPCRWFYNGIDATLWFKSWTTSTINAYLCGILVLIALGVLHEAVGTLRSSLLARVTMQGGLQGALSTHKADSEAAAAAPGR